MAIKPLALKKSEHSEVTECFANRAAHWFRTRILSDEVTAAGCPNPNFKVIHFLAVGYPAGFRHLSVISLYPVLNIFIRSHSEFQPIFSKTDSLL